MKTIVNHQGSYRVGKGEVALSTDFSLSATGVIQGVVLAITQGDQKMLAHVLPESDPDALSCVIQRCIKTSEPFQISLRKRDDVDTSKALGVCKAAFVQAGIVQGYDCRSFKGGSMVGIELRNDHEMLMYFEKKGGERTGLRAVQGSGSENLFFSFGD